MKKKKKIDELLLHDSVSYFKRLIKNDRINKNYDPILKKLND